MTMTVQLARRRFTVEEFERMGAAGILGEDDRVELLDGEIVEMTPIGPGQAGRVNRLNQLLVRHLGDRAVVAVQNPVRLGTRSQPQPDVTIAKPRADFYTAAHPGPDDVLLLIEVADTSAAFDRDVKVPLYAAAGIPEVWVLDAPDGRVVRYRQPGPEGYREIDALGPGETLAPGAFPDVALDLTDVLGA